MIVPRAFSNSGAHGTFELGANFCLIVSVSEVVPAELEIRTR
jgi:hypothetical protein